MKSKIFIGLWILIIINLLLAGCTNKDLDVAQYEDVAQDKVKILKTSYVDGSSLDTGFPSKERCLYVLKMDDREINAILNRCDSITGVWPVINYKTKEANTRTQGCISPRDRSISDNGEYYIHTIKNKVTGELCYVWEGIRIEGGW